MASAAEALLLPGRLARSFPRSPSVRRPGAPRRALLSERAGRGRAGRGEGQRARRPRPPSAPPASQPAEGRDRPLPARLRRATRPARPSQDRAAEASAPPPRKAPGHSDGPARGAGATPRGRRSARNPPRAESHPGSRAPPFLGVSLCIIRLRLLYLNPHTHTFQGFMTPSVRRQQPHFKSAGPQLRGEQAAAAPAELQPLQGLRWSPAAPPPARIGVGVGPGLGQGRGLPCSARLSQAPLPWLAGEACCG